VSNRLVQPHKLYLSDPSHRHLILLRYTVDGNNRCHRYTKNTDRNDRSLLDGQAWGYFPSKDDYSTYLAGIPVTREVSATLIQQSV
jgi:hypothetical protein